MENPAHTPQLTSDFNSTIRSLKWVSLALPMIDFLFPYIANRELNASAREVGYLIALMQMGILIISIFAGFLTDRYTKKILMIVACLGASVIYILMYMGILIQSLNLMYITSFFRGLFHNLFLVPLRVLIAQKSHQNNRSFAYGKMNYALGMSAIIGGIIGIGPYLFFITYLPHLRWIQYFSFLIFSATSIYGAVMIWFRVDENKKIMDSKIEGELIDSHTKKTLTKAQKPQVDHYGFYIGLTLLWISLFLSSINNFITQPFIQIYIIDIFQASIWGIFLAYGPGGVLSLILAPKLGNIADRMNPLYGITIFSILGALATFLLIQATSVFQFSLIFLFDMSFGKTSMLLLENIFSRVTIKHRGKVFGFSSTMQYLGGVLAPIIGGFLWEEVDPTGPFVASIIIELGLITSYILGLWLANPHFKESYNQLHKFNHNDHRSDNIEQT